MKIAHPQKVHGNLQVGARLFEGSPDKRIGSTM